MGKKEWLWEQCLCLDVFFSSRGLGTTWNSHGLHGWAPHMKILGLQDLVTFFQENHLSKVHAFLS